MNIVLDKVLGMLGATDNDVQRKGSVEAIACILQLVSIFFSLSFFVMFNFYVKVVLKMYFNSFVTSERLNSIPVSQELVSACE